MSPSAFPRFLALAFPPFQHAPQRPRQQEPGVRSRPWPGPDIRNRSHPSCSLHGKDGVLRVDAYWFVNNVGNPSEVFFPQFWNRLREADIPVRLHWGKRQPMNGQDWVAFRAPTPPASEGAVARWRRGQHEAKAPREKDACSAYERPGALVSAPIP